MNYRSMSPLQLNSEWARLTSETNYGARNVKWLDEWLEGGYSSSQILEAMYTASDQGIAYFSAFHDRIHSLVRQNVLDAESNLVTIVMPWLDCPPCFYNYWDMKDGLDIPSVEAEAAFAAAKLELEEWVDESLGSPAVSSGSRFTPKRASRRVAPRPNNITRIDR